MSARGRWSPKASQILSLDELDQIVRDLRGKARRSRRTAANLIIFRLAACCGLRASEISGLSLRHVRLTTRPHLTLPGTITKGGVSREVPLWWDMETLADLRAWQQLAQEEGAKPDDPFVSSTSRGSVGQRLNRDQVRRRFIVACSALGRARRAQLTTHSGRHSYISLALAGGRSLAQVRDAAGHGSIAVTNLYTHVAADSGAIGRLFSRPPESPAIDPPMDAPIVKVTRHGGSRCPSLMKPASRSPAQPRAAARRR